MSKFYIFFKGYRLVGDVNFQEASKVAGYITPVPGIKKFQKSLGALQKKSRVIIKSIYFTQLVLLLFSQ